DHQDRRPLKLRDVEGMAVVRMNTLLPVVLEHVLLEPVEADTAKKPRRHDPIGVDVVATQRQRPSGHVRDRSHQSTSSRTSVTAPATAAAATIAGLISSVRPVGLPCRPLKLRFDEAAHTWLPSSLSGFMPRHIEQPAPRHSNPASRNSSASPSRSAARLTASDPGTTRAFTPGATWRPRMIRAASR